MRLLKLLTLSIIVLLSSCTKNEIIVKVETVPCTFHPSGIIVDVNDGELTRAVSSPRVIHYLIDYTNPAIDDLQSTVIENTLLELNLAINEQFTYYFVYDDDMTELSNDSIRINSSETFHAQKTMTINRPINESVVLTRESANFIAKKGKIPGGTTLHINAKVINTFNWKTGNNANNYTEHYSSELTDALPYWMRGSDSDNIEVEVQLKNINGKVVKSATYQYQVAKNHIKTVIYNVNNIDGNSDDFFVSIDDAPMNKDKDENQQIGR